MGDAAIFFEGNLTNPDKPDTLKDGSWTNTGSRAFHIGVVNDANASAGDFTMLELAESSGAVSIYGGDGVNVRKVAIKKTGAFGGWVRCEEGGSHIYFVAPPPGWGPEEGYKT